MSLRLIRKSVLIFCCTGLLVALLAVVPSPSLVSDRIKRHVQVEELAVATQLPSYDTKMKLKYDVSHSVVPVNTNIASSNSTYYANNASNVRFMHCKDDIFWPQELDQRVKPPFSKHIWEDFAARVRSLPVVSLESGCSRSSHMNRMAVLSDGTRVCCRYPNSKTGSDVRGELYSFHLNGLLGLWNIPPAVAVKVNVSSWQWSAVKDKVKKLWKEGNFVIMSLFIYNLEEVYFPSLIKDNSTFILSRINALPFVLSETNLLIQWTDMIIFDFLVGNNDRTVDNLRQLKRLPHMQEMPIHNLFKTKSSELVLLDHETTFNYKRHTQIPEHYSMQLRFLNTLCLFRENTITAILHLNQIDGSSPIDILANYIQEVDPHSYSVVHSKAFIRRFKLKWGMGGQMNQIMRRVRECSCQL